MGATSNVDTFSPDGRTMSNAANTGDRPAPKVSVLMSCFNSDPNYLRSSLTSITSQTLTQLEFLVWIDGELSKECREIIRTIEAGNSRITIIDSPKRVGLASALNALAKLAKSEFLARMDDDDISEPDRLEKQLAVLNSSDTAVLGTGCTEIDDDGTPQLKRSMPAHHAEIQNALVWRNPIIHPSVMMRKTAFEQLGGYDTNMPLNQDYDLWMRANKQGMKLENLPSPLIKWRRSKNAMGRRRFKRMRWDIIVKTRYLRENWLLVPSLISTIVLRSLPPFLLDLAYSRLRPGTKDIR
jgi:glycosyltransferase involved in cell wall biosynthesis